jgi:hypothetical protein
MHGGWWSLGYQIGFVFGPFESMGLCMVPRMEERQLTNYIRSKLTGGFLYEPFGKLYIKN